MYKITTVSLNYKIFHINFTCMTGSYFLVLILLLSKLYTRDKHNFYKVKSVLLKFDLRIIF